jgi:hypothetical protein
MVRITTGAISANMVQYRAVLAFARRGRIYKISVNYPMDSVKTFIDTNLTISADLGAFPVPTAINEINLNFLLESGKLLIGYYRRVHNKIIARLYTFSNKNFRFYYAVKQL